MAIEDRGTVELLERWRAGDRRALEALIGRDLPWIEARVRRRMGPLLRARAETCDLVQDAVIELIRYGPRFLLANRAHFRALLARIVENVLRGQHDRFSAYKRAASRERPLPADSELARDPLAAKAESPSPSRAADQAEWEGLVRLGLELLEPPDREIILLREWDGLAFGAIGERAGISADAARMRFHRALAGLASAVSRLRSGDFSAIESLDGASEPLEAS